MASTLAELFCRAFSEASERPALYLLQGREPDLTISYRRLLQGAAGYARAYAEAGLRPGDVVVLILPHGEALVYAFWGAVLAGAVPAIMPFLTEKLAPDRYRQELAALVQITRPSGLVTYSEFVGDVRTALAGSQDNPVRALLLAADVEPDVDAQPSGWPGLSRNSDDGALLQHSSGTTGLQKGVSLSHQAVLNQLAGYSETIGLAQSDVVVSWLPLYHDMGLIAGFVMPIASRVPLVLMSPFDWVRAPHRLMQAVSRYRGTLSWLPNFAYNFCAQKVRDRDLEGVDLSSWRAVINCSEPMRWESHQAFRERFEQYGLPSGALATCYAMAENVFAVTQSGLDGSVTVDVVDRKALIVDKVARPADRDSTETTRLLSAGRPLPNVRLQVLDEQRRAVPERHVGEIALHSDCMLSGYFNRPDLTNRAFHEHWYLTGDLGYQAQGELYVTGRIKDLIIVGGKNVHPQDLESLASEVPGVHAGRVVAFGVFNSDSGTEDVVVVAEVDGEVEAERGPIAEAIRQTINRGSDVAVRYIHIVGARWVLKTSSGKVARSANREKYLAETTSSPKLN